MDRGWSSLGLAPFVRCPVDKLLSMNSVRAFKMILQLFFRTLSEFFLFILEGVEFGSLWAPKLSTEQIILEYKHTQHWCQSARG